MTESTARAERIAPQSTISAAYLWEVAQKPVAVRMSFPLIDRLEREVVENFRSLTSRGSEIGGILLGAAQPGAPILVTIDDYETIECDYSRGPLYRLSDADMGRFERAIEQRAASGLKIVGFFRSHTRKGLSLDAEDLSFFAARFKDPFNVSLLVRPFATKASTAGIFIWENGAVQGESSYLEFPFRSSQLSGRPSSGSFDAAPPNPAVSPAAPPPPAEPAAPKPATRAQIVPIASRREINLPVPPAPLEAPPQAAPPQAPPPAPTPVASAPAPAKAPTAKPEAPKPEAVKPMVAKAVPVKEVPKPASDPAPASARPEPAAKPEPVKPVAKAEPAKPAAKPEPPKIEAKPEAKAAPAKAEPKPEPKAATAKVEAPKPAPVAAKPEAPVVEREAQPDEKVNSGRGKSIAVVLVAAAALVLCVALFVYPGILRRGPRSGAAVSQDGSQLSLRVERTGTDILLTWNRDAAAIRNAVHAVLTISDGDRNENYDMDLNQLRNGSIVYSPLTADVSFKMEVTGSTQAKLASESVRVLRTRPSPMPDDAQTANAPNPTATAAAAPTAKPPAAPQSAPTEDSNAQEVTPATKAGSPAKPFNTASLAQRLRPATPTDVPLPDAPTLNANPAAVSAPPIGSNPVVPSYVPPPSAPAPVAAAPQPAPPVQQRQSRPTPGGQISQATVVYSKQPEYPKLARQMGVKGAVELIATIGTDGHVKSVKVEKGHPLLTKAATDAVMQWIYKPTLLNGTPVENDTHITLNFLGDR